MRYAQSVTDLVGNTPLVRLNRVTAGIRATVLAKVEYFNPGGSAKDRIAKNIIDAAERDGLLRPGGTIVEPTSGNTGVGLALVAQQRGYRMHLRRARQVRRREGRRAARPTAPRSSSPPTSVEPDDPRSYYSVSDRLVARDPRRVQAEPVREPERPAQPLRDDRSRDLARHRRARDALRRRHRHRRHDHGHRPLPARGVAAAACAIVGVDPEGSIYSGGPIHGYDVEGVGEDFWPEAYDPTVVDEIHRIGDAESFAMTRRLAREEGLLVGGSSGMAVVGALRTARDLPEDAVVVVLLPDHGRGYLSKLFDDDWMRHAATTSTPAPTTDPNPPTRRGATHDRPDRTVPARGFDSLAVHAGQAFDPTTGAVIPPVHFSTTYAQDGIGGLRQGYEYGRSGNPTRTALETQLAALEGGRARPVVLVRPRRRRRAAARRAASRVTKCCSATTSTAARTG